MECSEFKVGDYVLITDQSSNRPFSLLCGDAAKITAISPDSFEAGGFGFRKDGAECNGHHHACLLPEMDWHGCGDHLMGHGQGNGLEAPEWPFEDIILPLLLSTRSPKEWLGLGLPELRRISALFEKQPEDRIVTTNAPDLPACH